MTSLIFETKHSNLSESERMDVKKGKAKFEKLREDLNFTGIYIWRKQKRRICAVPVWPLLQKMTSVTVTFEMGPSFVLLVLLM